MNKQLDVLDSYTTIVFLNKQEEIKTGKTFWAYSNFGQYAKWTIVAINDHGLIDAVDLEGSTATFYIHDFK